MYAKYEYNASSTLANILNDLVLILTGTTDVNSLSADCNKTNSTILATVPAGWTVHDASAGSGKKVLKAAYVDNPGAYKYAEITVTSSYVQLHANETWNETAHTYTFKTGNTAYYQPWISSAGRFYVFSSARFIAIASEYTGAYGDVTYSGISILAELSRNQPWNTVASGYPSMAVVSSGYCLSGNTGCWVPRAKNNAGNDVTTALYLVTAGCQYNGWGTATSFPQGVNARVYDTTGGRQIPFFELLLWDAANFVTWLGDLSTIADIWAVPKDLMAHLETTTKAGTDYLALQANNSGHRWVFRKG